MRGAAHTRTVHCVCSRNEILQAAGGRDGKGTRHSRAPVGEGGYALAFRRVIVNVAKQKAATVFFNILKAKGINISQDKVLLFGISKTNKLVWLETGSPSAGLEHILVKASDYEKQGIAKSDIGKLIFDAVMDGRIVGMDKTRPIYEVMYKGEIKRIAITVGDNGYIVSAHPISRSAVLDALPYSSPAI